MSGVDDARTSEQRGQAYWFLAKLYAEQLDAETIDRLVPMIADGDGFAESILAALRVESDRDVLAERLAVEHTRLFRAVQEHYGPPPPYESLWREGQLMGESTVQVATNYLEAGFEPDARFAPCDHIVAELQFMASLCHAEHEAWQKAQASAAHVLRARQARFLDCHLGAWMEKYCTTIAEQSREPLYRALASVTAEMVKQDGQHVRADS